MLDRQTSEESQAQLLCRIAARDRQALAEFYDQTAVTLFSTAIRILGDAHEAEEVIQDAFLQIWGKAATFDAALGKPFYWALSITRNRAIDRLRARQRRVRLADELHEAADIKARFDDRGNVEFRLNFVADASRPLELRSCLLPRLPLGHRQFLSVTDESGETVLERLLGKGAEAATILRQPGWHPEAARDRTSVAGFLALGMKHILTGYDHLLFLFALLALRARGAELNLSRLTTTFRSGKRTVTRWKANDDRNRTKRPAQEASLEKPLDLLPPSLEADAPERGSFSFISNQYKLTFLIISTISMNSTGFTR